MFKQNDSLYGYPLNELAGLRCVGLPGDRLHITNGRLWVNAQQFIISKTQKRGYIMSTDGLGDYNSRVKFVQQYTGFLLNDFYAIVNLDSSEYIKLKVNRTLNILDSIPKELFVDSIAIKKLSITRSRKDSMPEIYVPRKGDTITINQDNFKYYRHGFEHFISIGNEKYVAQQNMFFVIGDNWIEATDSRHFGLINENKIIGVIKEPKQNSR